MINRLKPILLQKQKEVTLLYQQRPDLITRIANGDIHNRNHHRHKAFEQSLCADQSLAVIAEIKRRSPSKGLLASITDPLLLADAYVDGGANAISILTDHEFFAGNLDDLALVAQHLQSKPQTILRKDFIIDEIQIAEAIVAGADAVLLMVSLLGEKIADFIASAKRMNIAALVEVHDKHELDIALASGASIIGINNRDLTTFTVDTERSLQLVHLIPDHVIKVAESGINSPLLANTYFQAGFNAVLIGEALVQSQKPQLFIKACRDAKNIN